MAVGTLKWFHQTKGFGFITPDTNEKDVFVHISAVQQAGIRNLTEGEKLSFDVEMRNGRAAAVNLRR